MTHGSWDYINHEIYDIDRKLRTLTKRLQKILKISRIFKKCANLWRSVQANKFWLWLILEKNIEWKMQKSLFHLGDTIWKTFWVAVGSYSTCRSMGCYLENAYFHHWKGTKLWFTNADEIFARIKVEMSDGKKSVYRTKSRNSFWKAKIQWVIGADYARKSFNRKNWRLQEWFQKHLLEHLGWTSAAVPYNMVHITWTI